MISLYEQTCFRQYLERVFLEEKSTTPGMTLALYARRLGLAGSTLNMIISGQRNLTLAHLHAIARALKMPPARHEYFEALVLLGQADCPETRTFYSRRLKRLRALSALDQAGTSESKLVSDWILPALLIYLKDVKKIRSTESLGRLDPHALASRFGVTETRMKTLLKKLETTQLLNFTKPGAVHIVFDRVTRQLPQKAYLLELSRELGRRIERDFNAPDALFRTFTFTCDRGALTELRSELVELMERFMARPVNAEAAPTVQQVLLGAFTVA